MIVAKTKKGKGVAAVEDKNGAHGKPLDDPEAAIAELGGEREPDASTSSKPEGDAEAARLRDPARSSCPSTSSEPRSRRARPTATRSPRSARRAGDVVAIDGEVSNSTFSEMFKKAHPDRFVESYIAEQQMVAAAVGIQVRGWTPFTSTFAAFLSRAYDFVRMAAISRADLAICGSHAGVSIGEDGPSQMALEDLAMFRAVHGSTVLYPCDGNQTAKLVATMADLDGISYLRTTRGATRPSSTGRTRSSRSAAARSCAPPTRPWSRSWRRGSRCTRRSRRPTTLAEEGIEARVIDCYSVKPIDEETLLGAGALGPIVTVEDHWPEGGLGEAVLAAFADAPEHPKVTMLAVREMPGSGKPAELLAAAGIDAAAIAKAAKELVRLTTEGSTSWRRWSTASVGTPCGARPTTSSSRAWRLTSGAITPRWSGR